MKNVLLTTTALVAFAGAAVADVSLSGSADIGYNDAIEDGVFWDADLSVSASADLGDGYTATLSFGMEFGDGTGAAEWDKYPTIEITSPYGSLKGGDLGDEGASEYFYADLDGMELDVENHDSSDRFDIRALVEFGAFGVTVGGDDVGGGKLDGFSVGAGGTFGNVTVGIGYDAADDGRLGSDVTTAVDALLPVIDAVVKVPVVTTEFDIFELLPAVNVAVAVFELLPDVNDAVDALTSNADDAARATAEATDLATMATNRGIAEATDLATTATNRGIAETTDLETMKDNLVAARILDIAAETANGIAALAADAAATEANKAEASKISLATTAVSLSTTLGSATVGLSYAGNSEETSIGIAVGFVVSADLAIGVYYASNDVADDKYGVSADYTMGALGLGVYYDGGNGDAVDKFGIDISYEVMAGLKVLAGVKDDDGTQMSYAGVEYAINDNLMATVSWADADEISGPEFKDGTTIMLSASF